MRALWQIAVGLAAVALAPSQAFAYPIQSSGTPACHEQVTLEAWRRTVDMLPETTTPLASRGEDEALMADVPFEFPASLDHIGVVTLLLGVRDNDIKNHAPNGLDELPLEASDPNSQSEHCLRTAEQDEPEGSRQAVEDCRTFIREALLSAIDGLDGEGRPDSAKRMKLRVSLAIRDEIDVSVPRYFLQAGRALHALQDSFTHSFRNPEEPGKIRVVLNFVELTQDTLDEAVDGPPHASELDDCDDADELRAERRALAIEASSMALIATLDPDLDAAAKSRAVDSMLDDYVAFDDAAECTLENGWCEAAERSYGSPTLGCHAAATPARAAMGALFALGLVILGIAARRRRRLVTGLALLGVTTLALPARAEDDPNSGPIDGPVAALSGDSDVAVKGKEDKAGVFLARIATGASYDNSALSGGIGGRYAFARNWMLGLDAEWNPYVAVSPRKLRPGSANAYFSLIRRFQLAYAAVNLRSSVAAGGSMLLFDLVGADKYSMGPFFGVSFLGIEWKMGRGFYLTVDPTYIAIPIPNVVGIPFMYAQYRFQIGLEFGG